MPIYSNTRVTWETDGSQRFSVDKHKKIHYSGAGKETGSSCLWSECTHHIYRENDFAFPAGMEKQSLSTFFVHTRMWDRYNLRRPKKEEGKYTILKKGHTLLGRRSKTTSTTTTTTTCSTYVCLRSLMRTMFPPRSAKRRCRSRCWWSPEPVVAAASATATSQVSSPSPSRTLFPVKKGTERERERSVLGSRIAH